MGRWERPLCLIGRSLQKQQNPEPLRATLLRCASNRASVTVRRARKVTLIRAASFDLLTFVGGVRRIVGESRLNWSNLYTRLQTSDSARVKLARASRLAS